MKQNTKKLFVCLGIVCGLSSLACATFVDRAIDRAVGTAANRVGDKVGERVGDVVAAEVLLGITPDLIQGYSIALFRMLFYHGGVYVSHMNYKPGQFTRWSANGVRQGEWFERVLLKRNEDGSEWWRVESRAKSKEGEKEERLVLEALLSKGNDTRGTRKIRRMRALYPGEKEHQEVPISEANSSTWVLTSSQQLTSESLDGMTVGTKKVTVPAGEFSAKHVQMKRAKKSMIDWYLVDSVPGGVVLYKHTVLKDDGDKDAKDTVWEMKLMEHGEGMTQSKLGIDFNKAPAESVKADAKAK